MSHCDIFNRPYFNVPPDCEQVRLLYQRVPLGVPIACWTYGDQEGRVLASPKIYFGTLLIRCEGSEDAWGDLGDLAEELGAGLEDVMRVDLAWCEGTPLLLRSGITGKKAIPYNELSEGVRVHGERYIAGLYNRSLIDHIMKRGFEDAGRDVLFDDEEQFYEGFLGLDLLPPPIGELGMRCTEV